MYRTAYFGPIDLHIQNALRRGRKDKINKKVFTKEGSKRNDNTAVPNQKCTSAIIQNNAVPMLWLIIPLSCCPQQKILCDGWGYTPKP